MTVLRVCSGLGGFWEIGFARGLGFGLGLRVRVLLRVLYGVGLRIAGLQFRVRSPTRKNRGTGTAQQLFTPKELKVVALGLRITAISTQTNRPGGLPAEASCCSRARRVLASATSLRSACSVVIIYYLILYDIILYYSILYYVIKYNIIL